MPGPTTFLDALQSIFYLSRKISDDLFLAVATKIFPVRSPKLSDDRFYLFFFAFFQNFPFFYFSNFKIFFLVVLKKIFSVWSPKLSDDRFYLFFLAIYQNFPFFQLSNFTIRFLDVPLRVDARGRRTPSARHCQQGNKLGAQLGPMSITKLSPNWACQTGPVHCHKFLLPGIRQLSECAIYVPCGDQLHRGTFIFQIETNKE